MSQDNVGGKKKKRKIWKINFPFACFQAVRLLFYKMYKVWLNPKRIYENQKPSFRQKKKNIWIFIFVPNRLSPICGGLISYSLNTKENFQKADAVFHWGQKKKKKIKYARGFVCERLGENLQSTHRNSSFRSRHNLSDELLIRHGRRAATGARRWRPEDDSKIQPQQHCRPLRVIVSFSGNVTWQRRSRIVRTDAAQSPAVPALYHVRMASPTACLISGLHSWMSQKNKTKP